METINYQSTSNTIATMSTLSRYTKIKKMLIIKPNICNYCPYKYSTCALNKHDWKIVSEVLESCSKIYQVSTKMFSSSHIFVFWFLVAIYISQSNTNPIMNKWKIGSIA